MRPAKLMRQHIGDIDALPVSSHRWTMTVQTNQTDDARAQQIVAIATRGDRAAFIALFEFYAPRIKAQAMRHGASSEMAEDIVQDAMLAVWRRAAQFDPARGAASAWVFTIAANARIDRLRRDRRLLTGVDLPEGVDTQTPALTLDAADDADALTQVLDTLPDDQRRIITLSFYTDISHSEIAATLGIPLGTVKSRVRLALAKLRLALGDRR